MEGKGTINGHEYVDLGLPSGLLWATCNVGATTPEGNGSYFAWGETTTKSFYCMDNYKFLNGSSITRYTKSDRLTVLKDSDDAATVNWGGSWRMPTKDDFEELWHNCKWQDCSIELIPSQKWAFGYKVIGPNGNSIFLPKAGCLDDQRHGNGGHYWTKTRGNLDYTAWRMMLDTNDVNKNIINLCYISFGISVRPVASKRASSTKSNHNSGCYVATSVYGSYNCPQVWTLRRFRDNTLDETWYGRAFIKTYYAISPTLVRWFGETSWFKEFWRKPLDKLVASLRNKGVEDTPNTDQY